ncbi:ADP-ribosylglycohydrolase family protein [Deinococcus cellulosilyticus]|uniref:ADP-ribosylglycohydrolase n=1 Tax=Deinococcus cellulosilyticus (strain DSM 18568 / NBRC 106333 / KACC 11606 / 5516J-15) TaxID=1223518 RepID=A0A511N0R4_DEIC1|nr:ADP-ribosylglycohydrolase family protein [Deinococcus cellulosilyticus]GEM46434.1 hypothetical protein DC3_20690 [Deinococcus cellulosilyticus NBRC 106333 = KACC 11606]
MGNARGVLYGLAFGDAYGYPTEFLKVPEILRKFPPAGPEDLGNVLVSDDTQMALAVSRALVRAEKLDVETLEPLLRQEFIEWANSEENTRAPGMTCMRACERLEKGLPWVKATEMGSKGCGANMRVAPVGVLNLPVEMRSGLAQFQAALTHGHPTGLAASDATAQAIHFLMQGMAPERVLQALLDYAEAQLGLYHHDWLGSLWEESQHPAAAYFIARGWRETMDALLRVKEAMKSPDFDTDPCLLTGAGWIAEEALATGLYCFLLHPEDPRAAFKRAAVTSGDSDSIACLTGSFLGAYLGDDGFPQEWFDRIEYRDELEKMAAKLPLLQA